MFKKFRDNKGVALETAIVMILVIFLPKLVTAAIINVVNAKMTMLLSRQAIIVLI